MQKSAQGAALMAESNVAHIIEHAPTKTVVATLKKTMDDAEMRIDTMTKVLQCACGTDCVAYQKKQQEWAKKGSIPTDARSTTVLPDIGTFEYPHQAPFVVCRGLHVFDEPDKKRRASARARGLTPGDVPQAAPLERKPRLGCNQGGCIVCADCFQCNQYIDNGNCKGCLRRKVMLPPSLADDPKVGTLFIPHDECTQLYQISAINKEVNALKPLMKNTKDLSGRLVTEVGNQRLDRNGQQLDEYEDDEQLCLKAVGVPTGEAGSASDAVLVDNLEAKKVRAEKEAGNALFQATQTHKELVATESELRNCKERREETQDAATKSACDDSIANIEARKEGIATKLAAQEKQQASTFGAYYDLSKAASERPYAELSKEEQDSALAEFRQKQGAEVVAPNPEKSVRKAPVRKQTAKQIKEAKYAEILDALQKQQAKPDHVYVNESKKTTANKKRQAILDQQEMQWKSKRFAEVRERRDQWFADSLIEKKHRKFLKASLSEKLATHSIPPNVFHDIYSEATKVAQEKMDAFQGECMVEGGEDNETPEQTADREKRKRNYQEYYDKKYSEAYKNEEGEYMPLSDCEDADDGALREKWRAKAGKVPVVFNEWIKTPEGRAVAAQCNVLDTLESVLQQEGASNGDENSSTPPSPTASTATSAEADAIEAGLD